jgi:large conductance mechanosensitive channel
MLEQFKQFLVETNAIALAVGVVIGGAVSKLVSTIVSGLLMPLIGLILPGGEWRKVTISLGTGNDPLAIGEVVGATLDFLIIAAVVYIVIAKLLKIQPKK